jgi:hypothetical protein
MLIGKSVPFEFAASIAHPSWSTRRIAMPVLAVLVHTAARLLSQLNTSFDSVVDGIQLGDFVVGFVYDVGTSLGCYLMAERAAQPVIDKFPALVTPLRPLQFRLSKPSPDGKVVPMRRPELSEAMAADRPPRRRRNARS